MDTIIIDAKKISNFKVGELIGSGGMANIYKATQLSLERPVALKVMHKHLTLNENFVVRFEKEAKRAAMLHHENIVSIIDYGCQDNEYFIAMEYIEGQNLKEMMTRLKRLPLEVALLMGREIANGLKYAHSNGLVHRDVKPANIMLSSDGRLMITDFGIAKDHHDLSITDTGQMVGSPAYMSPEQAAGRPIDNRCDLFSLGIVLYEIITGEKPFKGENYQQMITSIISATPVEPSKVRVDVTPNIENIINKALTKDIESRYQDADVMVNDIDNELKNYIIPSPKKLISEFLKNPIRTTEKLRTDRISTHTEKALYFVNLGHGRLADATREFENVLRYDKNNKMAREYLDKLRSGQANFEINIPHNKSNRPFYLAGVFTALFLLIAISAMYLSGINPLGKNTNSVPPDTSTIKPNLPLQTGLSASEAATRLAETKNQAKQNNPAISKTSSSIDTKNPPASKKTPVNPVKGDYNYPAQDLTKCGTLKITSSPPAVFSIDMQRYGATDGPPVKLAPGRHVISVELNGYRSASKRIFIEAGKNENLHMELTLQR